MSIVRRNRMGTAALLHSPLSVTDRIRGVERQMLRMLHDAEVGIWPTLPDHFRRYGSVGCSRTDRRPRENLGCKQFR
jgi:hypothetical protein